MHPQVVAAVKACAAPKTSKWCVKVNAQAAAKANTGTPAAKAKAAASGAGTGTPAPNHSDSKKKSVVEVTGLESLWQSMLLLRRVRNTPTAPLVWQGDRVVE